MTEITASKEEIEKALEELDRAVKRARKVRIEGERFLRETRPERERIRADLRRAGLLRD
jgi:cell division septum initiation protein DivIVA